MKKVLILHAYFPPFGGIAMQRVTNFVKSLNQFGWEPVVVTIPKWGEKGKKDYTMLDKIPSNVEVHRIFYFNYRKIVPGEIAKLFKPIEKKYLFPDVYVIWNYFAYKFIKKYLKQNKVDVAYVCVSPFSTLLLAHRIKQEFNIPVVADFRDAFSFGNYYILDQNQKEAKRAYNIEERVFNDFNAIIQVTPYNKARYEEIFPQFSQKIKLITNGFDDDDFKNVPTNRKNNNKEFTLGYNGTFSRLVPLQPLLDAITTIYKQKKIKIRFSIATPTKINAIKSKNAFLFKEGLINYVGYLSHKESLLNLSACDAIIFIFASGPATKGAFSGKIFEYIRMNRPILFLNEKGSDASKIIEATRTGVTINIDNQDEIISTLLEMHNKWKEGKLGHSPDWNEINKYERRVLTQKLVEVFDEMKDKER